MKKHALSLCLFLSSLPAHAQPWYTTGQPADRMLSGLGFDFSGGALLYNHPSGLASDGTRLLLCDRFNNRVLIWSQLPDAWDDAPDLVLGQANFTSNNSGDAKNQLNFPGNVSVGANGVVAVADTENDRILIWNAFPTAMGQPADRVLYLPALTPAGTPQRYEWPWGVWTDGVRLAVTATHGGAILFWNTLPLTDNQKPDYTIQLPQFGTLRNISTDGATYFFVGDHNSKVTPQGPATFFWNTFPTSADQPYDWVFPEWIKGATTPDGKLVAGGLASCYLWNKVPTSAGQTPDLIFTNAYYANGDGPDVAVAGGRLYINNYNGNNVQVYNITPTASGQLPDFALGSPDVSHNTLREQHYLQNPVVATDGSVLIATSDFDKALWIWKTPDPATGQDADVRINLKAWNLIPWDNAVFNGQLALAGLQRVALWNNIPLNGEAPAKTFNGHIGSATFTDLKGVAWDEHFFYLAESDGKIYLWNSVPVTGNEDPAATISIAGARFNLLHSDGEYLCVTSQQNPVAVYVFRVQDLKQGILTPWKTIQNSMSPGASGVPLNLPASAAAFHGSLAIANTSWNCVLLWKDIADAGDPAKVLVLGQQQLVDNTPGTGAGKLFMPASLCWQDEHLWVGEFKFSSRLLRFSTAASTPAPEATADTGEAVQVFPNPFRHTATLHITLSQHSRVSISARDALGHPIQTLYEGPLAAGPQAFELDGRDWAPGLYYLTVVSGLGSKTFKLVCAE